MKLKCKQWLFFIVVFILLFAATVPAEQVQTPQTQISTQTLKEKQFAIVTKGRINKKKLKKGDTLKISLIIKDKLLEKIENEYIRDYFLSDEESREVVLVWQSSKKQEIEKIYSGKYNKKTKQFKISDKIKIPKGMQTGKWKLSTIAIYSGGVYDEEQEAVGIYNANMKWSKESYLDKTNEYVDLSFADFEVRGTGKKLDKDGPSILIKSLKLSKKTLKKGIYSKFSLKASDKSGMIKRVRCTWASYNAKGKEDEEHEFYEMKYNKKKKAYECIVIAYLSTTKLREIELEDCYGNRRVYYWSGKKGKEYVGSYGGYNLYEITKTYSLKKKDKKAIKSMVITKK